MYGTTTTLAQDLGQIGKTKLFKLTGGVAANAVYYDGTSNRAPFTYFLSGNVNLNISNVYNIPLSFSYSNQKFVSSNPFSFNRLSIHPSYKWITSHIGDVSMTFSPYTLSGHQFTGLGVDITPEGKWNVSAMYGRLLKESEYNEADLQSQPGYNRIGYGVKTGYNFSKFSVNTIFFKAEDDQNSIENPVPIELDLKPKENAVVSLDGRLKFLKKGEVYSEFALSSMTEDINAIEEDQAEKTLLSSVMKTNASTNQYKAYKLGFSYAVAKGTIGVGYEYIDPEYRTLGAYYFNNDLENITINATQNIFDNKVNIAFNGGLQRDDLNNEKTSQLQRVVSAVNVTYNASEKLNLSGAYSNFQSFTNIKNEFDYINEVSQTENLDTLNFQQISRNANFNINYVLKDTEVKRENIGFAASYNNALNKQNDITVENGDSNFYNGNASYSLGYPKVDLVVSTSLNINYSKIGTNQTVTLGPVLSINKQFLNKQLRTNSSFSYNQSVSDGLKQVEVLNIRLGSNYSYKKKHNLSLNLLSQFRKGTTKDNAFTATFGYNYIFDKIKLKPNISLPKLNKKEKFTKVKKTKPNKVSNNEERVSFKYRDSLYEGTLDEVNVKLEQLEKSSRFNYIPSYKKEELDMLLQIVVNENKSKYYKPKALKFLKELYSYEDFLAGYNQLIYDVVMELKLDMKRLDYAFEKAFVEAEIKRKDHKLYNMPQEIISNSLKEEKEEFNVLQENSDAALTKLIGHRWMLTFINKYEVLEDIYKSDVFLSKVIKEEQDNIFEMWDREESDQKVYLYIITRIIDHYIKESVKYTDPNVLELKYVEKR